MGSWGCSSTGFELGVGNAGEITLCVGERSRMGAIKPDGIDGSAEVGDEEAAAGDIEREADRFHQVADDNVRRQPDDRVDGGAVYGVSRRRIPAVGPIEQAAALIELEIDRFGQAVAPDLDVATSGGCLALGDVQPG